MTNATKSIFFFGIYLIIVGLLVMAIPNLLLSLITAQATNEVWIRICGLFAVVIGYYYIYAARHNLIPFYQATVFGRFIFAIGIAAFVMLGFAKPILLLVSVIDISCAFITNLYLRKK